MTCHVTTVTLALRRHGYAPPAPSGKIRTWERFGCTILSTEGDNHGDVGRANAALRERQRRGLRRLTIEVSEDDLRAIAKRGYEGAVTTDLDRRAQAAGLFLNEALLQT
jgi:hypothetical protein